MVYRRRPAELYGPNRDRLLDALGRCRRIVNTMASEVEMGSPTTVALGAVRDAIDGVAEIVTGGRRFYYERGTTIPPAWQDKGMR